MYIARIECYEAAKSSKPGALKTRPLSDGLGRATSLPGASGRRPQSPRDHSLPGSVDKDLRPRTQLKRLSKRLSEQL